MNQAVMTASDGKWLVQGEPVEALIGDDGEVYGYYREDGVYVRRDIRYRSRRDLAEVYGQEHEASIPIRWDKYVGGFVPLDEVLEFEECAAHDERWRLHQALQERAERMLTPRMFRDVDPPELVTAFAAIQVVESNNERASAAGCAHGLTPEAWENIVADFAGRCAYCGERKKLVLEHVIPISSGGGTTIDNIVPACARCNTKKSNREPAAWLAEDPERLLTFIGAVAMAEGVRN